MDDTTEQAAAADDLQNLDEADFMEMPCVCQHCNRYFELNDGRGSEKWFPQSVICARCAELEEAEIERDDSIASLLDELSDAVYDKAQAKIHIKSLVAQLAKLGVEVNKHGKPVNQA